MRSQQLAFAEGVNVICGASDTGKSFLAEVIDFMLGGSTLKELPERVPYASASLAFTAKADHEYKITRALSGGNFQLTRISADGEGEPSTLRQQHVQGRTDNLSGFLLEAIGLSDKRILKSKAKSTTQSLSFRNLARLIIVQEGDIQSPDSPFLSGQFTSRTSDLATVKLLLTGVDDAAVVSSTDTASDTGQQLALMDEIIGDLTTQIEDAGHDRSEVEEQAQSLSVSIEAQRETMRAVQSDLDTQIESRRVAYDEWARLSNRKAEIGELLARFALLGRHYEIDQDRLRAIEESGSLFVHIAATPCPLCGSLPEAQHQSGACDGDVDGIVQAARAEAEKIDRLLGELQETVGDLNAELDEIAGSIATRHSEYQALDAGIRTGMAPLVSDARSQFSELIEKRAEVQLTIGLFEQIDKLHRRRDALILDEGDGDNQQVVESGIPDSTAFLISLEVEKILKAWHFPGECRVHFDKGRSDFIIDGKPRGSRGKGLRAISHAAISIALMEYCRERDLPHPGFVVLDSPLLAYFKPEGEEDEALQGTDLKERFYDYLTKEHGEGSQVIIIENDHPPQEFEGKLSLTVFTRNPSVGRFGLL